MAMWSEREEQLLEELLACAGMRDRAHDLALGLLERFGSLRHVFTADSETLMSRAEITPKIAALIRVTGQLCRGGDSSETPVLCNTEDIVEYLRPQFLFRQKECLLLLLLDAERHPLRCCVLQEGTVDMVRISVQELVSTLHSVSAKYCVLLHNHLSGSSAPSQTDERSTQELQEVIELNGIHLLDHIIFSDVDYTSMVQAGLFHPVEY